MYNNEITSLMQRILSKDATEEELEEMDSISKLDPDAGYQFRQIQKFWDEGRHISPHEVELALARSLQELDTAELIATKKSDNKKSLQLLSCLLLSIVIVILLLFWKH